MSADVEKVARQIMLARGGCNVTDWNERHWNPAVMEAWNMAQVAMRATRLIDAEALREGLYGLNEEDAAEIADWLTQRAIITKDTPDER